MSRVRVMIILLNFETPAPIKTSGVSGVSEVSGVSGISELVNFSNKVG